MLKRTALFEEHQKAGGRLIDFGGWELPVQYTGVMDEHTACREKAGLFDVSHMGEFHVSGRDAESFLNYLLTNDVSQIQVGQAQYSLLAMPDGGLVDDLIVYKRSPTNFLVVVNASNTDKDYEWFSKYHQKFLDGAGPASSSGARDVKLSNESANYTQIALQGRLAQEILQPITDIDLSKMKTYFFGEGRVDGLQAIVARTGYTGEDGFEIYVPWNDGPKVWQKLMAIGGPKGMKPVGLGARDTLRLEMKYPLYGNELSAETNPIEAGLGWVVKLEKGDFVGRNAIQAVKTAGPDRKLVGLKLLERGIPRHGYSVYDASGKEVVGVLTSGTQSPSTKEAVGVAYVATALSKVGTRITVDIRGTKVPAEIVATPFYKRNY